MDGALVTCAVPSLIVPSVDSAGICAVVDAANMGADADGLAVRVAVCANSELLAVAARTRVAPGLEVGTVTIAVAVGMWMAAEAERGGAALLDNSRAHANSACT